jgi:glucose-6-phosphate-specific signal transduction histidine kinase
MPRVPGVRTARKLLVGFSAGLTLIAVRSVAALIYLTQLNAIVRHLAIDPVPGSAADAARHRSIGLAGMRERAQLVGGGVSISSAAGAGTTVLVQIPWREAASV